MATQRANDETDIRQRIERYAAAIRAKDLEAMQHMGAEAKRRNRA